MSTPCLSYKAAEIIKERMGNLQPKLGLVLGSGLNELANDITEQIIIPYAELPGFPESKVDGHAGRLIVGKLNNIDVACYQGRFHFYEGIPSAAVKAFIRTLKLIGCEAVLMTNAAGSLHTDTPAGSLMLITDHINLSFSNPLVGENDADFGDRFPAMENVYDINLRKTMLKAAKQIDLELSQGVYIGVLGPSFETVAEIRAFRRLGADAVGMSTVPEAIVAAHCGLKVVAISAIVNLAAGMEPEPLSHDMTIKNGKLLSEKLKLLIEAFSEKLYQ